MTDDFDPHELDPSSFIDEVHSFEFWFEAVEGYLTDRTYGHDPDMDDAPLDAEARDRLITTLCNYCVAETAALDGASGMVEFAPNRNSKIFLATQAVDEARHLEVFTRRLRDLGVDDPEAEIDLRVNPALRALQQRLRELVAQRDWQAALFAQNVILEAMENTVFEAHAASADAITAQVLDGVMKDERRHLGFGENDLGRALHADEASRASLRALRSELDSLVLDSLHGALRDIGAPVARAEDLGADYLAAVERLGLT